MRLIHLQLIGAGIDTPLCGDQDPAKHIGWTPRTTSCPECHKALEEIALCNTLDEVEALYEEDEPARILGTDAANLASQVAIMLADPSAVKFAKPKKTASRAKAKAKKGARGAKAKS